jgi:hypothetical protein
MNCTSVVVSIIEQALLESDSVSKFFVVGEIKIRIPSNELFNKIANYKSDRSDGVTDDAVENILRGAKKVYRDAIRGLVKKGIYRTEGTLIYRSNDKPVDNVYEYEGQLRSIDEWARLFGLKTHVVKKRLAMGWSIKKALQTSSGRKLYEHDGEKRLLSSWARLAGLKLGTLLERVNAGWEFGEALTTPLHNTAPLRYKRKTEGGNTGIGLAEAPVPTFRNRKKELSRSFTKLLLDLLPNEPIARDDFFELFRGRVDDSTAIEVFQNRAIVLRKHTLKTSGRCPPDDFSQQEMARRGRLLIFTQGLFRLRRDGFVEKPGNSPLMVVPTNKPR